MLAVFGTVALDTIRTPARTLRGVLGGAATFASVSASMFARTGLIAAVGRDFPARYRSFLARHVDLAGLSVEGGKTFRYDGRYGADLASRETVSTHLNVLEGYRPEVPEKYRKSRFVYLANNNPAQNAGILEQFDSPRFVMCDTIDLWIRTERAAVIRMIRASDAVCINLEEAQMLTKERTIQGCAKRIRGWGARYAMIKEGEHGSVLFFDDVVFPTAAFPARAVDPTGAGDSFAGAMMGYMASKNSASSSTLRRAAVYGNVMGSIAVEGYGTAGLARARRADIAKRFRAFERAARF